MSVSRRHARLILPGCQMGAAGPGLDQRQPPERAARGTLRATAGRRALPRPGSPQGRLIRRAVSSAQLSSAQGRPERPGERSRVDGRSGPIRSAGRHNDIRLAATSQDFKRSGLPTGPWLWAPATRS
jgi:hypothetical protein